MRRPLAALVPMLLLATACDEGGAPPMRVWAAASLTDVLGDVVTAFRRTDPGEVEMSFDASNRLARQIERGAPADVLVSADAEWMTWARERDLLVPESERVLATGSLVVVVPADAVGTPREIGDLASPDVRRIALAGESVPAGRYADSALARAGIAEALGDRIVRGGSVRATLAWVAEGEVDAGVVYRTDAAVEPRVRIAFEIDDALHAPIEYPAAIVRGSTSADRAGRFLEFSSSPDARAIFERAGFGPPGD